jgi:hypothetical protein
VDDHITPALYLETTEPRPDVLQRDGVERVTWWENCRPGRDELPRELDEFERLSVYEVADGFTAPSTRPDGVVGLHFRHYPRPAQGILTGRPTSGLLLVLISPKTPDDAQALRDWADFVHIQHIAATANPGYTMITPYENVTGGDPRFMHFYEMDCDDPEAAYRTMTRRVIERLGGSFGTPAFDEWAFHPALRIMYVNTFRRLGEQTAA